MVIILSPSKTLREEKIDHPSPTSPLFPDKTVKLMRKLQQLSRPKLKKLMSISDVLTDLNYTRFKNFNLDFKESSGAPAVYTYQGDAYLGLDATSWSKEDLDYAESRLLIMSGLYGLVHPSTLIQPYRLEMGGRLTIGHNTNLRNYWSDTLTLYIDKTLQSQDTKILINLASKEYADALDLKQLTGEVVNIHFREWRHDQWKFISYDSKKARGTMAKYIIQNRIEAKKDIEGFNLDNYRFNAELSSDKELFFTR